MPRSTTRPRLPHASDPIRSSIDAIAVVSLAIHRPLEAETIAFFLDDTGRSNTITVISGTTEPDSILSVAECMGLAGGRLPTVCASCWRRCDLRAHQTFRQHCPAISTAGGGQRDHRGAWIELIEWFVIGPAGVDCPRELLGEPERW